MLPSATRPVRLYIVDDHLAIREALAEVLGSEPGMDVCGTAATAAAALHDLPSLRPDVVIVDVSLKDTHGLDLVQNVRAQYPTMQVVVFSMYDENVYAERAIRAGASAYLMKSEPTTSVIEAVRTVARGEVYLSHRMTTRVLAKLIRPDGFAFAVDAFTDREMAVFQMLGEGHGVEDIADRLNLSRKTVETYRRRAKEKLGFESVSELLQFAVQWVHGSGGGRDAETAQRRLSQIGTHGDTAQGFQRASTA